ncbi:MAG TPA: PIN domain-containing protein, partial [Polyangiaceae bacterium]|nr:PIN domain-containing protein [Polyangiaceae bacterium]
RARGSLTVRARAIAHVAHERGALLRVPAPVLAEVCRGSRFDAAVNALLNRGAILVPDLTREIAQRAGALLARTRMSSANAIDAFVVATALEFDTAVIATGDAADLTRLAAPYSQISVMPL